MMLGCLFVPGFHVEKRQVRVYQLFLGAKLFRFVTLLNGPGIVAFAVIGHAKGELGIKVVRVLCQNGLQLGDGRIVFSRGEIEHCIVVLFLSRRHNEGYCMFWALAQANARERFRSARAFVRLRTNLSSSLGSPWGNV